MAMKMAILLGDGRVWSAEELKKAGRKRGHEMIQLSIWQCVFHYDRTFRITYRGMDLRNVDAMIIRAYGLSMHEILMVAEYVRDHLVLIDAHIGEFLPQHKMYNALQLSQAGLPTPRTVQFPDRRVVKGSDIPFPPPYIMKMPRGAQGKNVYLVNDIAGVRQRLRERSTKDQWLVQEYIPCKQDYRILILGGKALGAIERSSETLVHNYSQGGKVRRVVLPSSTMQLAVKAARVLKYDFCGVDIMMSNNKPLILEVNHLPQWQGFQRATGIPVAEKVIEYIEERHRLLQRSLSML